MRRDPKNHLVQLPAVLGNGARGNLQGSAESFQKFYISFEFEYDVLLKTIRNAYAGPDCGYISYSTLSPTIVNQMPLKVHKQGMAVICVASGLSLASNIQV